ncbi:unnamed protein product [Gordionus sp. m RMFG-2023]
MVVKRDGCADKSISTIWCKYIQNISHMEKKHSTSNEDSKKYERHIKIINSSNNRSQFMEKDMYEFKGSNEKTKLSNSSRNNVLKYLKPELNAWGSDAYPKVLLSPTNDGLFLETQSESRVNYNEKSVADQKHFQYKLRRILYATASCKYPGVYAWIYRHNDGKRNKPECRCHAVLLFPTLNLQKIQRLRIPVMEKIIILKQFLTGLIEKTEDDEVRRNLKCSKCHNRLEKREKSSVELLSWTTKYQDTSRITKYSKNSLMTNLIQYKKENNCRTLEALLFKNSETLWQNVKQLLQQSLREYRKERLLRQRNRQYFLTLYQRSAERLPQSKISQNDSTFTSNHSEISFPKRRNILMGNKYFKEINYHNYTGFRDYRSSMMHNIYKNKRHRNRHNRSIRLSSESFSNKGNVNKFHKSSIQKDLNDNEIIEEKEDICIAEFKSIELNIGSENKVKVFTECIDTDNSFELYNEGLKDIYELPIASKVDYKKTIGVEDYIYNSMYSVQEQSIDIEDDQNYQFGVPTKKYNNTWLEPYHKAVDDSNRFLCVSAAKYATLKSVNIFTDKPSIEYNSMHNGFMKMRLDKRKCSSTGDVSNSYCYPFDLCQPNNKSMIDFLRAEDAYSDDDIYNTKNESMLVSSRLDTFSKPNLLTINDRQVKYPLDFKSNEETVLLQFTTSELESVLSDESGFQEDMTMSGSSSANTSPEPYRFRSYTLFTNKTHLYKKSTEPEQVLIRRNGIIKNSNLYDTDNSKIKYQHRNTPAKDLISPLSSSISFHINTLNYSYNQPKMCITKL